MAPVKKPSKSFGSRVIRKTVNRQELKWGFSKTAIWGASAPSEGQCQAWKTLTISSEQWCIHCSDWFHAEMEWLLVQIKPILLLPYGGRERFSASVIYARLVIVFQSCPSYSPFYGFYGDVKDVRDCSQQKQTIKAACKQTCPLQQLHLVLIAQHHPELLCLTACWGSI